MWCFGENTGGLKFMISALIRVGWRNCVIIQMVKSITWWHLLGHLIHPPAPPAAGQRSSFAWLCFVLFYNRTSSISFFCRRQLLTNIIHRHVNWKSQVSLHCHWHYFQFSTGALDMIHRGIKTLVPVNIKLREKAAFALPKIKPAKGRKKWTAPAMTHSKVHSKGSWVVFVWEGIFSSFVFVDVIKYLGK